MAKCFVVQDLGKYDLAGLKDFGEKVVMIDRHVSNRGLDKAFHDMRQAMRDITDKDYIVPSGHPALIAFAGAIMSEKVGVIRILSWDSHKKSYLPAEVEP